MTTTLFDAILKTAECLKNLRYGVTTSAGSTTALVDTSMVEPDEYFNGGTIFMLSGTLIGKSFVVTDYDATTTTFTFAAQTAAPGSGASYALLENAYTRESLIAAVNAALSELSPLPIVLDDPTFVTVADQEQYTLPTGVSDVRRVFIATNTTAPYGYQENKGWFENNGSLYFDVEPPAEDDFLIRLYYEGMHDTLTDDADTVSSALHPDVVAWTAAYHAALVRSGYAENSEPHTKELIGLAMQQMLRMQNAHPVMHFRKMSRGSGWE